MKNEQRPQSSGWGGALTHIFLIIVTVLFLVVSTTFAGIGLLKALQSFKF
jgi:hypothetical protein